eukprot:1039458-Heterocapsa_arctica.AAC.1
MGGEATSAGASETVLRSDLPAATVEEEEATEVGLLGDTEHGATFTDTMHPIPDNADGWAAAIQDFDDF